MARGCAFPPLPVKHLLFSCLWPSRDHTGLGPLILCSLSPAVADLILVRCKSYSHTPSQRHFFSSSALSCHSSDTATSSAALSDTRRGTLRRRSFRRQTIRRSIGPSALGCSFSAYCSSRRLHMRFFALKPIARVENCTAIIDVRRSKNRLTGHSVECGIVDMGGLSRGRWAG